ncbi:hypothetical protein [Streptomyces antimycoticus]|uniref:hypothetical protein n=1 Tax=Streptomyces antimycoticus TaxID=68175 RepID=UPI000A3BD6CE|nr:hypothetical protein [Streptomyces antimycoticus]
MRSTTDAETGTPNPSLRHLLDRAILLEQRIRRAVHARQLTDPNPDDAFRGLYLSDETIHRLLDAGRALDSTAPDDTDTALLAETEARADAAARAGRPTRLSALAHEFGLSALDVEILLIALIPDLDDRFERFYGYLNDDVTRRRPSIGLALGLCGRSAADAAARAGLSPQAPLRAGGLLLVEEPDRPFLARALRVPDRVTAHLLGDDTPDPRIVDLLAPWQDVSGVGDPAPLARALASGDPLAYLREDQGGAGTALGASALARAGHGVLGLDLERLARDPHPAEAVRILSREARITSSGLVCGPIDALIRDKPEVIRLVADTPLPESAYLLQRMETFDGLAILATNLRANLDDAFTRRLDLVVDFPLPDADHRRLLWDRSLGTVLPRSTDLDLDFCAESFELAGGNIRSVAVTAAYLAAESGSPVTMSDLIHALQREYQKLGRLTLASEFGPYMPLLTG